MILYVLLTELRNPRKRDLPWLIAKTAKYRKHFVTHLNPPRR